MLIFVIEDVSVSEDIYSDAIALFVSRIVLKVKYYLLGLALFCVIFNYFIVFLVVNRIIVVPIRQLSDQILMPKN